MRRFEAQKRDTPMPDESIGGVLLDTSRGILSPWSAAVNRREGKWGRYSDMYKITYMVLIWKRSVFGFWYRAPKLRTAHVDRAAAGRLGRLFTFEDLMGVSRAAR